MNEPISLTYHQAQAVAELSAKARSTGKRYIGPDQAKKAAERKHSALGMKGPEHG